MSDQIGWEIQGTFYPHVGHDGLLHGDHALMREVTGLSLAELDTGEDPDATETAWIAVAVWHQMSDVRRDVIRKFIEQLPLDAAKAVGFEKPKETPPLDGGPSADSGRTSSDSDSTPVDDSSLSASPSTTKSQGDTTPEPSSRNGSGDQASDTGATSHPAISGLSTSAAV